MWFTRCHIKKWFSTDINSDCSVNFICRSLSLTLILTLQHVRIAYKYQEAILTVSELIRIFQVYFIFILEVPYLSSVQMFVQKLKAKYWNVHTNTNPNSSFISVQSHLYYTKSYHRVLTDVREQKGTRCQVSRGLRHLCCKAKGQPQKYLGNSLHLRESVVSPGMQVQQ